ncbi:hypothetical protein BD311DRAFT_607745, partial [Dichomitus squalens]
QWLKHYATGLNGKSCQIVRQRQYRLNNLKRWYVKSFVASIPVLLLVVLILFLTGLIILLFHVYQMVAVGVVAILVAALGFFLAGTTFLPACFDGCSYQSPQAAAGKFIW